MSCVRSLASWVLNRQNKEVKAQTLFWTFVLCSILSYIGALFGMDLCDYDLSLPPEHPYNMAVQSSVESPELLSPRSWNTFEVWTTRSSPWCSSLPLTALWSHLRLRADVRYCNHLSTAGPASALALLLLHGSAQAASGRHPLAEILLVLSIALMNLVTAIMAGLLST